ncbi:MAG TPA: CHASE3 domain-containing protein [Candidatus Binataceae bacterium]|nr:CHASE3 domain-containing protein [Candidatus Binataceae bacterium]
MVHAESRVTLGLTSSASRLSFSERSEVTFHSAPIWIGFGLAALVCALVSAVVGWASYNFEASAQWVEHTHFVMEHLGALRSSISEAENAQRNFIISGQLARLDSFANAERETRENLAALRKLTADNPAQVRNLDRISPLIDRRLEFLDQGIEIRKRSGNQAAEDFIVAHSSGGLGSKVRDLIRLMSADEDGLMATRTTAEHRAARLAYRVISVGWIFGFVFLSITGVYIGLALGGLRRATELAASRARQLDAAELKLTANTEVLQSVFASMGEGVIVSLQDEAEPQLNPAARQLLGIADAPGGFARWLAGAEIVSEPEGRLSNGASPFALIANGANRDDIELTIRDGGGSMRRFVASLRPLRDEKSAIRGGVLVFRDDTERKRLEESQGALAAIVSATPDAVVSIAPDGMIRSWNRGAEAMYGHTATEAVGQFYETLVVSEDLRPEFRAALRRVASGDCSVQFETRRLRKTGIEFDASITDFPIADETGRVSIGSIARDVTESKRVERELIARTEELSRSNGELEQFAYVASHDLQEPLRMVTSYLQLIAGRYRGKLDSDADEFIAFAVDGATRMKQLIDDLLHFSRAGQAPRHEPVDMNRVRDEAVANLHLAIDEAKAHITSDTLPTLLGDPVRMRELLQNLLENAVKFRAEKPPEIHVGCVRHANEYIFSVRDNGIGIAPQYQERIFVMFRRLHGREAYRGTGIGLAICKRVVERLHGRIWVESAPGTGATFFFSIPCGEGGGRDERARELEGSGHSAG